MAKVEIKNTSGQVLSHFVYFRDIQIDEIILIANEAVLGPEIEQINKEFPLNTFDVCLYDGRLKLLVNDIEQTVGNIAVQLFDTELELTETIEKTTILRANSLTTQVLPIAIEGNVVVFERTLEAHNLSVIDGVLLSLINGTFTYSLTLNLDVIGGFNGLIESWFEYFDGSNWLVYPNSGKLKDFSKQSEGYVSYHGILNLLAGSQFRLKVRATKTGGQLLATTLANGTGVVSAAITVHS